MASNGSYTNGSRDGIRIIIRNALILARSQTPLKEYREVLGLIKAVEEEVNRIRTLRAVVTPVIADEVRTILNRLSQVKYDLHLKGEPI